ncbi:MAG: hypothetical protein KDD62_11045, partial [Bdellovibrionales bacterium]|nr:hypothetical protein [Bdellovibrionales bacterium]
MKQGPSQRDDVARNVSHPAPDPIDLEAEALSQALPGPIPPHDNLIIQESELEETMLAAKANFGLIDPGFKPYGGIYSIVETLRAAHGTPRDLPFVTFGGFMYRSSFIMPFSEETTLEQILIALASPELFVLTKTFDPKLLDHFRLHGADVSEEYLITVNSNQFAAKNITGFPHENTLVQYWLGINRHEQAVRRQAETDYYRALTQSQEGRVEQLLADQEVLLERLAALQEAVLKGMEPGGIDEQAQARLLQLLEAPFVHEQHEITDVQGKSELSDDERDRLREHLETPLLVDNEDDQQVETLKQFSDRRVREFRDKWLTSKDRRSFDPWLGGAYFLSFFYDDIARLATDCGWTVKYTKPKPQSKLIDEMDSHHCKATFRNHSRKALRSPSTSSSIKNLYDYDVLPGLVLETENDYHQALSMYAGQAVYMKLSHGAGSAFVHRIETFSEDTCNAALIKCYEGFSDVMGG